MGKGARTGRGRGRGRGWRSLDERRMRTGTGAGTEKLGPVAANPDNLENNKEAGGGSTRYPGLK